MIAKTVREFIEDNNINQKMLAKLLGIDAQQMSRACRVGYLIVEVDGEYRFYSERKQRVTKDDLKALQKEMEETRAAKRKKKLEEKEAKRRLYTCPQ